MDNCRIDNCQIKDDTICVLGPALRFFISNLELDSIRGLKTGYALYRTLKDIIDIYCITYGLEVKYFIYPDTHFNQTFGGTIPSWNYITSMIGSDIIKYELVSSPLNIVYSNIYKINIDREEAVRLGLTSHFTSYDMLEIDNFNCFNVAFLDKLIEHNCRIATNFNRDIIEIVSVESAMINQIKIELQKKRESFIFESGTGIMKTSPIMRPKNFPEQFSMKEETSADRISKKWKADLLFDKVEPRQRSPRVAKTSLDTSE